MIDRRRGREAPYTTLAYYLAGSPPAPNPPGGHVAAAAASCAAAIAREIAGRFLRPDTDAALEREVVRAYEDAPPGGIDETLAARGLVPPALAAPTFDFGWRPRTYVAPSTERRARMLPREPPWWVQDVVALGNYSSLPRLIPRWPSVAAGLELLDETTSRLAPWGWEPGRHRVVVSSLYDAGRHLHEAACYPNLPLSAAIEAAREGLSEPEEGGMSLGEKWFSSSHNGTARLFIEAHCLWRAHASVDTPIFPRAIHAWGTPQTRGRTFSDLPDPFAPLVDVLRLGLAALPILVNYSQHFVLLVPCHDE